MGWREGSLEAHFWISRDRHVRPLTSVGTCEQPLLCLSLSDRYCLSQLPPGHTYLGFTPFH